MRFRLPTVKIRRGETDHISISGRVTRRPTVLIYVGRKSLSRKAAMIGLALVLCQFLDGLLTYIGLRLMGVHMEGNNFLRSLMISYGMAPALFAVKLAAMVIAVTLAFQAHRRKWMRPVLVGIVAFYLLLAVAPWTYLIAAHVAEERNQKNNLLPAIDHHPQSSKSKETSV